MSDYHYGALWQEDGRIKFRLWAPSAENVALILDNNDPEIMKKTQDGWVEIISDKAGQGSRYGFLINGKETVPDPASRYQPEDVSGLSEITDPHSFTWHDESWKGMPWEETVVYELHVGSFTEEGTFSGVEAKLDYLKQLGITAIELMPIADFPGKYNWGYDGVYPYAPDSAYGTPDDLKAFINSAHHHGIMVFLDVVYNHFGPSGNYINTYAKPFFTDQFQTPWGSAIDYSQKEVRQFFIENALYWLEEFHFDGLRFDAVHAIIDESPQSILSELAATIRAHFPTSRHIHLILENDKNEAHYLTRASQQPEEFTAQWNDDIHHVLHVLLTGEISAYYRDYKDNTLTRLGRCLAEGFDYQGQPSLHRNGKSRGEASGSLPPSAFIAFLQNHDQIGNRAKGERITMLTSAEKIRFALSIILLSPQPPLIFMGEEWMARSPFPFFCDFTGDLANAVRVGRKKEFPGMSEFIDPIERSTFESAKLEWSEQYERISFVKQLLEIRKNYIVPLLKQQWIDSSYQVTGDKLEVYWKFSHGRTLHLLANVSPQPLNDLPEMAGDVVWPASNVELGAYSVVWWIEEGSV